MTSETPTGDRGALHVVAAPHVPTEVVIRLVIEIQSQERSPVKPSGATRSDAPRSALSPALSTEAKRDVTFAWPSDAVDRVRDQHRRLRRTHKGLTMSGLLGAALGVALNDPPAWT